MTVDKSALKKLIDTAKPGDIHVCIFSGINKDADKLLKNFIKKNSTQPSTLILISGR